MRTARSKRHRSSVATEYCPRRPFKARLGLPLGRAFIARSPGGDNYPRSAGKRGAGPAPRQGDWRGVGRARGRAPLAHGAVVFARFNSGFRYSPLLFAMMLGVAATNRFIHTPRLAREADNRTAILAALSLRRNIT
jgi:hypothetical protein